jgi:hypothetical protein
VTAPTLLIVGEALEKALRQEASFKPQFIGILATIS